MSRIETDAEKVERENRALDLGCLHSDELYGIDGKMNVVSSALSEPDLYMPMLVRSLTVSASA